MFAAAVGAGVLATPAVEKAARAPVDPQQLQTPGGPFVDVAFWLGAVAIAVVSFRIMENIYRKQDARLLSLYPIDLKSQFVYRFALSLLEVLGAGFLIFLFLLPIYLQTGQPRVLAGFGLVMGGLWVALTVGFAIQLYAGMVSFVATGKSGSPAETVSRLDAGGGTSAAFYFSPAAALVGSLALFLLLKLAVVDEWFARGASRLFWIGLGIPLASSLVSLVLARGWFSLHYPRLLARFYETDLIQLDTGYNYHKSAQQGRQGLFEQLVPQRYLALYRKEVLQISRRYPVNRLLSLVLWGVVAILAYGNRLGPWGLSAVTCVALLLFLAPWSRLYGRDLEPGIAHQLPIAPRDAHTAKTMAALRELLIAAGPCALLIVALTPPPTSLLPALLALAGPLALAPVLLEFSRRWGAGMGWATGAVVASLLSVAGLLTSAL